MNAGYDKWSVFISAGRVIVRLKLISHSRIKCIMRITCNYWNKNNLVRVIPRSFYLSLVFYQQRRKSAVLAFQYQLRNKKHKFIIHDIFICFLLVKWANSVLIRFWYMSGNQLLMHSFYHLPILRILAKPLMLVTETWVLNEFYQYQFMAQR